jgi:radical SAM superfamily enzyme YgiQ (UPF0313 family)
MPVYLPALAGALRAAGHQVAILEQGLLAEPERTPPEEEARRFGRRVRASEPDVVLFDVAAEVLSDFADLGRAAREAAPRAVLLAGGRHPTLLPEETLGAAPFLDGVVIGEPEDTLLEIASGAAPASTPGVAGRSGGAIVRGPQRAPIADLDRLPHPAWDLLDMGWHTSRTQRVIPCIPLRTATVQASRGCAGSCTFCSEGRLYPAPHRRHSAGYVVEAVRRLLAEQRIEGLYFSDENLLGDPERARELFEALIRAGVPGRLRWAAQVRADSVDAGTLALMRRAGCVQLEFGVESGAQRQLRALGKGTAVETAALALGLCRAAGIRTLASVMVGLPGETLADLRDTAALIDRARPNIVRLVRYIPVPGTALVRELVRAGRLPERFWERQTRRGDPFGGAPPPNLTALGDAELAREERRLYLRGVLPRYAGDFLRHARARDVAALAFSRFLPRLAAGKLRRRRAD